MIGNYEMADDAMNTTVYTDVMLRREAQSAVRQYGRQRKIRVRTVGFSLRIHQQDSGSGYRFPILLAHGMIRHSADEEAFTVTVAI